MTAVGISVLIAAAVAFGKGHIAEGVVGVALGGGIVLFNELRVRQIHADPERTISNGATRAKLTIAGALGATVAGVAWATGGVVIGIVVMLAVGTGVAAFAAYLRR